MPIARRTTRGGLTVNFTVPGKDMVCVSRSTAAETVVVVLERLYAAFGRDVLEKFTTIATGRGPLLSRDPARDFRNPVNGDTYTHHRIPGTDLHVLTQSSTAEKVDHVRSVLKRAGLSEASFRITVEETAVRGKLSWP